MKKLGIVVIMILASLSFVAAADEAAQTSPASKEAPKDPQVVFMPNLIGPLFGFYSGNVDFNLGSKISLDTEFGYFNAHAIPLVGDLMGSENQFWFGYLNAGPTFYFDRTFNGFFIGPYVKGAFFTVGDSSSSIQAGAMGVGAKAGWSGTWDWFSLSLNAGYEYSWATSSLAGLDSALALYVNQVNGGVPVFQIKLGFAVY